jgi:hypothetical protein
MFDDGTSGAPMIEIYIGSARTDDTMTLLTPA